MVTLHHPRSALLVNAPWSAPPMQSTASGNSLERCQYTKPGQENLHQPFPGFSTDSPFGAQLVFDDAPIREIPERQLRLMVRVDTVSATKEAVNFYADAAYELVAKPVGIHHRGDRWAAARRRTGSRQGVGRGPPGRLTDTHVPEGRPFGILRSRTRIRCVPHTAAPEAGLTRLARAEQGPEGAIRPCPPTQSPARLEWTLMRRPPMSTTP